MKQNRHQKIAELVSRYEIETQEELAEKLKEVNIIFSIPSKYLKYNIDKKVK